MINAEAYAKLNLGLRVGGRREDGFHPVSGIFQSIGIVDRLGLDDAESDSIAGEGGRPVADGLDNLAFRALKAVRAVAGSSASLVLTLGKRIPAAAGLGGGSADAAGALALGGRRFGVERATLAAIAPQLGSDVPFCLIGGTARVSGRGDAVAPLDPLSGFALAVVVPPLEITTPEAFRTWDALDGPEGLRMPQSALPPALRSEGDLQNDLYPAALALAPDLDDWRLDLEQRWGRPVMLSGSGPTLYGFFVDEDEAAGAVAAVPAGTRFAEPCDLATVGWRITNDR
jgi:4-diphosphocytidyl-2-C-methyl-D-erythritol kinase